MTRTTLKIPADHPAFAGHFPGRPILPGVLLLDAALQGAGAAVPGRQWQVVTVKFHHIVGPGEVLTLEQEALPEGTVRFFIKAGDPDSAGLLVASGTLRPHTASVREGSDG